jgi:hypothetical protein
MAKCPWCGDTFSMSTLVVHLPPLAELIGDDGEPISMADFAQTAAPMALAGAASGSAFGSASLSAPSLLDTDPAMRGASDLQDDLRSDDGFDASDFDGQRLGHSEVANEVSEFAEEGVTFADAGVPELTDETPEWNSDSSQQQSELEEASWDNRPDDSDDLAIENAESEDQFDSQEGSQPRPLAEVTDFGIGREDRPFVSRPRAKRQGSPIKSAIGIAIGGLMAFPLAAGILALAGKPLDLGFWPFDGQTISMSPESRRSAAPPMDPPPRTANNGNNGNRAGRSLAEDLPSLDVDPPSLADPIGDSSSDTADQPVSDDLDNLLAVPTPAADLAEIEPPASIKLPPLDLAIPTPAAEEPVMEAEISDSSPLALPAEPAPIAEPAVAEIAATPQEPQPAETPSLSPPQPLPTVSAELQSALEAASSAMGDVVNYDDSEGIKGRRTRLAALFAKVAAVASTASADDEAAVGSLVERLVDSDVVKDLVPAAPNWARFANRPNNGMLAAGKLVRENDQWLLQWNSPTPLEVRFSDPSIAEEGSDVIVLGTIQQTEPSTVIEVKYLQKQ